MSPAYNITLTQNIISDTTGPAIYLQPSQSDPTKGANALVAPPIIGSATTALVTGTSARSATIELYRANRPVGQSGLPVEYLGAVVAGADGKWSFTPATLAAGDHLTALQIRQDLNTSGMAANVDAVAPPPPPQPGDPLASDDFERSVASGWGDATTGGTWALTGTASDFSVSGGVGLVSVAAGQARQARLNVATADVWISGSVSLDRVPVGGNAFAYLDARGTSTNAYRATIRVSTTGAVFVQLKKSVGGVESNVTTEVAVGFTATPGSWIAFRFEVAGTHLQFRAWDAAGTDPGTWQTSADDTTAGLQAAGAAGIRAFTGGPVSNGPVVFSWDGIQIQHG